MSKVWIAAGAAVGLGAMIYAYWNGKKAITGYDRVRRGETVDGWRIVVPVRKHNWYICTPSNQSDDGGFKAMIGDHPRCLRNGFIDEDGNCVCPYGFTGSRCEILAYSSRFNVPTCGIVTEREGSIVSPNYPRRYSRGAFCQWLIEGTSPGDRILFRINDLDLEYENLMPGDRCADKLTFWPHGTDVVTKSVSCLPDELIRCQSKWYSTQYNWLLVEFRSDPWGQHNHAGFNVSYKIIDPPTSPPPRAFKGEQWRRKPGEKWKTAGKETVLNEARAWSASVKTRLLNTINRQGQLLCYQCDNETHCRENTQQRKSCATGEACAYHISEHGLISWRGCMDIETCLDGWPRADCHTENDQRCFHCCATSHCNLSHSSNADKISGTMITFFIAFILLLQN